jgi:Flp pilus assembly protein TadG
LTSRRAWGRQGGQAVAFFAVLATVLAGFVGLVIDAGKVASQQQLIRNAADGASLAGAYAIARQGAGLAGATALAQQVLVGNGVPTGDLTMTYLDSGGLPTGTPGSVATVRATVVDSRPTYFLSTLGITSVQVSATSEASTGLGGGASCGICVMAGTGTTLALGWVAQATVSGGPVNVNSTSTPNINLLPFSSLTAPSITIAGGSDSVGFGATITPTPVSGPALADPLAAVPAPSVPGPAVSYTAPPGTATISPGVYSAINAGGVSLTLNPGVYVLTGPLTISSGLVTGSGVMLYLACSSYPAPCASGQSGGSIQQDGGSTLQLSPPTSGTYSGLTVFADRNNSATNTFNVATVTVTGTWYTLRMRLNQTDLGETVGFGQLIVPSLSIASIAGFSASYVPAQSYSGSGGQVRLTL